MGRQEEKIIGRRLRSSYISTVISITLVLFVLGLLGLIILHAQKLSEHVRENIAVSVFLERGTGDDDIAYLRAMIDEMPAVRKTTYISSEEAARQLMEDLGEDFVDFLGYNPLTASVIIHLHANYANPDSLLLLEDAVMRQAHVTDVDYQHSLVTLVNQNVRRIGLGLLIFSSLLLMIAFALINNTIRLSVFSKRFLIKSMQLVGATQSFIRRPFIIKGVKQGVISSIITILLMIATLYAGQQQIPELVMLYDPGMLLILFGCILFLGVVISWISTFFAVRKYLKIKTDFLYLY